MGELRNFPAERPERGDDQRPLPHSQRAEVAVVASMIQDTDACAKGAELLKREQFFDLQVGWVFYACVALRRALSPVDRVTVEVWLRNNGALEAAGGETRLRAIADEFPETGNLGAHAAIVLAMHGRRELALKCRAVEREVCGPVQDFEAYKTIVRPDFGRLTAPSALFDPKPIGAAVEGARAQLQAAALGQVSGVRYPWERVEALVGLLVSGEQTIIAGPSEHGKTTFALEVAVAVAASAIDVLGLGEAVYVMTGEMPRAALLTRMACGAAGVDVSRARLGAVTPGEQHRIAGWLDYFESLAIVIDDQPAPAAVIGQRVREHKEAFGAGAVRTHRTALPDGSVRGGELLGKRRLRLAIGDHVQGLSEREDGRDERTRIGRSGQGWLDHVAKANDVASMLLSQLRAPNEDERKASPNFPPWPTVDWLFGAPNALKSTADTVLALQRPERYLRGRTRGRWAGVAGICALKRRFGGSHDRIAMRFERGKFSDDLPPCDLAFYEGSE